MVIYRCDKCSHEKVITKGIIGNEFEHGFETLVKSLRTEKVIDLCEKCFKQASDINFEARKKVNKSASEKVRAFLTGF